MAATLDVAGMWRSIQAGYEQSVHKNGDSRVEDWFLVYSPWPTLSLCLCYVVMCLVGPKVMADRRPFELKPLLVVYNFGMVALSFFIWMELFNVSRYLGYNYICDLLEYKTDDTHMRLAGAVWWFYFSKLIEFVDTFFFILRKKNSQITFLHVYHHSTMPFIWWIAVKWFAGGMAFFTPMLNCMVHVLMYGYYGLSVFPSLRKYLWWKRYITIIQLTQFLLGIVVTVYNLLTGCDYDRRVQWSAVVYLSTQFLLFMHFYFNAYKKPRVSKTDHSSSTEKRNGTGSVKIGTARSDGEDSGKNDNGVRLRSSASTS